LFATAALAPSMNVSVALLSRHKACAMQGLVEVEGVAKPAGAEARRLLFGCFIPPHLLTFNLS
jgi:hypothetical protein